MPSNTSGARTPGAKRAAPGEYFFDLAKLDKVHGGPDYTTAIGPCVEGDRMIVALMRMPAGTGAEPHSHPNEQWIFVVEGTLSANIGDQDIEATPGTVLYIPANTVHSVKATPQADGLFFTVKDASYGLQGVKAA
jgi:quercetin dioxygenase-like cupin family protein